MAGRSTKAASSCQEAATGGVMMTFVTAPAEESGLEAMLEACRVAEEGLVAKGFVRGSGDMSMADVMKLAGILAESMEEQHRLWMDKAAEIGVAKHAFNMEGRPDLLARVSEAQRQLAAQMDQGVEEILIAAIMAAQPRPAAPPLNEHSGPVTDMIDTGRQAQAEAATAPPSSSLAQETEVQQLRMQLKERDEMVQQLRGDVAALKSIKQESCTPLMDYTRGQMG